MEQKKAYIYLKLLEKTADASVVFHLKSLCVFLISGRSSFSGFGAWCLRFYLANATVIYLFGSLFSIAAGAGLIYYIFLFLRKTKDLRVT